MNLKTHLCIFYWLQCMCNFVIKNPIRFKMKPNISGALPMGNHYTRLKDSENPDNSVGRY